MRTRRLRCITELHLLARHKRSARVWAWARSDGCGFGRSRPSQVRLWGRRGTAHRAARRVCVSRAASHVMVESAEAARRGGGPGPCLCPPRRSCSPSRVCTRAASRACHHCRAVSMFLLFTPPGLRCPTRRVGVSVRSAASPLCEPRRQNGPALPGPEGIYARSAEIASGVPGELSCRSGTTPRPARSRRWSGDPFVFDACGVCSEYATAFLR